MLTRPKTGGWVLTQEWVFTRILRYNYIYRIIWVNAHPPTFCLVSIFAHVLGKAHPLAILTKSPPIFILAKPAHPWSYRLCASNQHRDNIQRATQARFRLYKTTESWLASFCAKLVGTIAQRKQRLAYVGRRRRQHALLLVSRIWT